MSAAGAIFRRELQIALRRRAEWAQPLVFYGIVALLFPLGIAPESPALKTFAPAIIWVGALLAALLGVERLFRADLDDGSLEQLLIAEVPLALLIAAKLAAQWLLTAAPLVIASPLLGYGLGLETGPVIVLFWSLLLGTPTLIFTGGFAAALTVGAPRAGLMLPILVLPLMTPAVIFGGGAVRAAAAGLSPEAPLYFLGALLALSLTLLPMAAAGALRNALG
ncbi:heme exporter protein CcmB [Nevskia sp.]|uniref:heme exporter protein CcmB n=1 Tax=Nevskia sp. TaxID=1929292 RepID=UPI0025E9AE14|nr:heme exporter protein CcmB [Nevskia sp.]